VAKGNNGATCVCNGATSCAGTACADYLGLCCSGVTGCTSTATAGKCGCPNGYFYNGTSCQLWLNVGQKCGYYIGLGNECNTTTTSLYCNTTTNQCQYVFIFSDNTQIHNI